MFKKRPYSIQVIFSQMNMHYLNPKKSYFNYSAAFTNLFLENIKSNNFINLEPTIKQF